jgi:hypothetical protein
MSVKSLLLSCSLFLPIPASFRRIITKIVKKVPIIMSKDFRTLIKTTICGALFQLVFSILLVDWLPLQNFGYSFYEVTLRFLLILLLIPLSVSFLVVAIFAKKVRSSTISLVGFAIGVFIMLFPSNLIGHELRMNEFEKLADRSNTLISAINSFKKSNGELPDDLQQLVPKYLDKYPTTNMAAYPNYSYSKAKNGESFSIVVECGMGILNWDEFIYESNGDYSKFSSSVKRVKQWIYFYE